MTNFSDAPVEEHIAQAAKRLSNWGRWGEDDRHGTVNLITPEKRLEGAACVKRGVAFSLALPFDLNGPQNGWRGRINPIRTMYGVITGLKEGDPFPHGFGGADDIVTMPLQAGTQWDGLGHIFDHNVAWNGRTADLTVTFAGDQVTGMEHQADRHVSRGVLLDVGRAFGSDGVLPDGFAITSAILDETIEKQGPTSEVRPGDIVLVRTGQLGKALATEWGTYAGGDAPGMSFESLDWWREHDVAASATDTWGWEVRPNEFPGAWQPMHQVLVPHIGFWIGEMWALDALGDDCAADGVYEFLLSAPPLPFTGAVGSPLNPVAVK